MNADEIRANKQKQETQWNKPTVPDKFDMQGMIGYLHKRAGRIPTENECLRFYMFLQTFVWKPTEKECTDFLRLLGMVKP